MSWKWEEVENQVSHCKEQQIWWLEGPVCGTRHFSSARTWVAHEINLVVFNLFPIMKVQADLT